MKHRLKFLKLHSSTSKTDVIQIGLFASSKNERGGVNVILKYKREKTYQTMFGALFQYSDINWYTCFVIKTNENFIRLKKSVVFHRPNLLTKSCFLHVLILIESI